MYNTFQRGAIKIYRIIFAATVLFLFGLSVFAAGTPSTLQVFSEDEDVYIYIDGYLKGKNSGIKKDIQAGEHYIKAVKGKKDGPMIFSRVVEIKKGEIKTIVIPAGGQSVSTTTVSTVPSTIPSTTPSTAELSTSTTIAPAAVPDLPIKVMDMDPMMMKEKNLTAGVYVIESSIDAIQPGDIVLSIDSNPLKDLNFYRRFLSFLQVGDAVMLEVLKKDGEKRTMKVQVLGAGKEKAILPSTAEALAKESPSQEVKAKEATSESTASSTTVKTEAVSPKDQGLHR